MASTNDVSDAEALSHSLQDVPGTTEQVSADGAMCVTRIYGSSKKSGVKSGRGRATINAEAWRRLRSSVSRQSSAIGCNPARLIINIRATKPYKRQNFGQPYDARLTRVVCSEDP